MLFALVLLGTCLRGAAANSVDYTALSALYSVAGGALWDAKLDWMVGADPCSPSVWEGATCIGGTITRLELSNNNLAGSLPTELGLLTGLTKFFDLSSNALTSTVPSVRNNRPFLHSRPTT